MNSKPFSVTSKAVNDSSRVIRFVGSDESIDRDGDTISLDGWDVGNYMKNPVVLFGHNYNDLPVARAISVTADKRARQLIFDVKFPTIEELSTNPETPSEHALKVDAIYNLAKAGFLNTVSVGFRGLEYEATATGRAYSRQELMEISIVPVPANPNAVAIMRTAGVLETVLKGVFMQIKAGKKLSKETREILKGCHGAIEKAVNELKSFIGDDDIEPDGDPDDKTGAPVVGEEIGTDVNDQQPPKKEFVIDIVEKSSTVEK